MIREADAKNKWCPFTRQVVTLERDGRPFEVSSANRFNNNEVSFCLGSVCMAWRSPNGVFGYCGLAGKDGGGR